MNISVYDWKEDARSRLMQTNASVSSVARAVGRSVSAVRALIRDENIRRTRGAVAPGPRALHMQSALSTDHVKIGHYIIRLRGLDEKTAFGDRLGVSAVALGKMESGRHDFTLRELQALGAVTGQQLYQLSFDQMPTAFH